MSATKEQVLVLIKASKALEENPDDKQFWLDKIESLKPEELDRLNAILEEEKNKRSESEKNHLERTIELNQGYISDLKVFGKKTVPELLRQMEGANRENPDNLLNNLNNA